MHITAYYFRAHTYTLVPHQIREDMQWMADHGTKAVAVSILEQDLFAARENLQWIAREAQRAGMDLYGVPSRWGSLVAGSPKVPSLFCARNPEVHVRNKDGSLFMGPFGPLASVHHGATFDFFAGSLENIISSLPVKGIIWDEIKNLSVMDYSEAALKVLHDKNIDVLNTHIEGVADFFDRLGEVVLSLNPRIRLNMFLYADKRGYGVERCARIKNLHDFGCDGRPYRVSDGGVSDSHEGEARKSLCDSGGYFIDQARKNGKNTLFLIENHAMTGKDTALMDKRLPEVLALEPDHLLYYYFPRSLEDPYENMRVLGKYLKQVS